MAWLCLVVIALIFYLPYIGFAPYVLDKNLTVSLTILQIKLAVSIPYTGGLRLFIYSVGSWGLLLIAVYFIEKALNLDILNITKLKNDLVYSIRPVISLRIARILAQIICSFAILKIALSILVPIMVTAIIPWLITHITPWLTSFIGKSIASQISSIGSLFLKNFGDLLNLALSLFNKVDLASSTVILSILVLISCRVHSWEKQYRNENDLLQQRIKRKQHFLQKTV